ncbi:aminodeoxychorismate synthase component I [Mameliella alba]|uniref:aminodeoxychorismate synthase component I n=1 Tax=Mameliella alba TaxID=561184 RepID=UPI00143196B1|nr:aminodeoxychorismate synthase component I [Mameliella alba]
MEIRFDFGPGYAAAEFANPSRLIRADSTEDVPTALAELDAARQAGQWLAGYASYELGYALEPRLEDRMPDTRRMPLLCFGVYPAPGPASAPRGGDFSLGTFRPDWDATRYASAFAQVHDWIGSGDIYQANLTFPLCAPCSGDLRALYGALSARQPVSHGALVMPDDGPAILSRSPELFFRVDENGRIATRPMKGTAPRGRTSKEDADLRRWLAGDEKTLAENLMIVDLLRNDLSRVATPGTVSVPELFKVETYETVHQMVSQIEARLAPGIELSDIFRALFPCGSITGAPKIRAMEVINDLETAPREAYCGAIGWAAPDGRSEFNVAIRTLLVENGTAVLNVGGGLVWDSRADNEYEEALWKSRFATFQQEPA